MNIDYNNCSVNSNRFDIRNHVEFDQNGRALCPSCSPNHSNNKKTLSLVPNTDGAYKCFRGCTPEEIRNALGQPKTKIVPTTLAKKDLRKDPRKDEEQILKEHSDLISFKMEGLKAIRWLANRGITTDIVKKYKLGICRVKSRGKMVYAISIPIPSYLGDKYYTKKRLAPWDPEITKSPDYTPWSQYGIPATTYFTYLPENPKETWLCEGEWDAILLGWLVQQHRSDVAVASFTCGCGSIPPQHELDRLPGEVVIFYDRNDKLRKDGTRAGEEGAKKLAKALKGRGKIAKVPMPENSIIKGWDISDAILDGYQLESFEQAALQAEEYKPMQGNSFFNKSRTFEEVFDQAPDYIDWLVPDLLTCNELYCLAAPPRRGKSLLGLALAKAVSSGGRFLDRPCKKGNVIYVGREDPDDKIKNRLIAQQWEREEMRDVLFNNSFTLDELPELIEYVEETQPSLIIFDTLSRIQTSNGKENSAEIADTLAPLQDLAQKQNVCVVVIHHTRKENKDNVDLLDIFDSVRGSGAIRATCRGMLVLAKSKNSYRLAVENGRSAEQDLEVFLNAATLTWHLKGRWKPPNVSCSQKDIVFQWFEKHNRGTVEQIHKDTLIPKRNLYEILIRLIHEESISRSGKQRNTIYYINEVQQVQQEKLDFEPAKLDDEWDEGQNSTKVKNSSKNGSTDHNGKEVLNPDPVDPFVEKKGIFIELGDESVKSTGTASDAVVGSSETKSKVVELQGQKGIKGITNSLISLDQNCKTTNFFDSEGSEEEEEEAETQALKGVWHKKLGYVHVMERNGSRLTVRQPGGRKLQTIYLRACDSRREYDTYCEI